MQRNGNSRLAKDYDMIKREEYFAKTKTDSIFSLDDMWDAVEKAKKDLNCLLSKCFDMGIKLDARVKRDILAGGELSLVSVDINFDCEKESRFKNTQTIVYDLE